MNITPDGESGFDPKEIEALEHAMNSIMEEESVGYQMIFWISVGAAKELLESFDRYKQGSEEDAVLIMREFSKIIGQLREAVEEDEQGY
jgi:hypothetical protein